MIKERKEDQKSNKTGIIKHFGQILAVISLVRWIPECLQIAWELYKFLIRILSPMIKILIDSL